MGSDPRSTLGPVKFQGQWVGTGLWLPAGLVIAGYAAAPYLPAGFGFAAATVIPFALLIPATAAADLTRAPTPWRSAPLVLLGELSSRSICCTRSSFAE